MKLQNKKVTISSSVEVAKMKLAPLAGRTGCAIDTVYRKDGSILGAWVLLDGEPYLEEQEWYFPLSSLIV